MGFNTAGPLLMIAIHLLVPQALMRNPEDYAQKVRRNTSSQSFKEDPSLNNMKDFVLDSITKRRRPVPRNVSVWDQEDDDQDEQSNPANSSRRRANYTQSMQRRHGGGWDSDTLSESLRTTPRSSYRQRQSQASSRPMCATEEVHSSQEVFTQTPATHGKRKTAS